MFLELTAAVFVGNGLSMGSIAAANLWLERKASKQRVKEYAAFLERMKTAETEVDQMVTEAVAKKTASPKRTKV